MEKISKIWSDIKFRYQEYRRAKLLKELKRDSTYAIQMMEFNNELFICHNGTPIVPVGFLNTDSVTAIRSSREAWISHKLRNNNLFNIY